MGIDLVEVTARGRIFQALVDVAEDLGYSDRDAYLNALEVGPQTVRRRFLALAKKRRIKVAPLRRRTIWRR